jgi:hypothetical protein
MKVVLAHGFLGLFDYFPLFFIGAAVVVIRNVLRDGQRRATRGAPRLPTNHWSRQVATATRKQRGPAVMPSDAPAEKPAPTRRIGAGPPHLRVLDGDAADKTAPRKFEPPPAGRSQAG